MYPAPRTIARVREVYDYDVPYGYAKALHLPAENRLEPLLALTNFLALPFRGESGQHGVIHGVCANVDHTAHVDRLKLRGCHDRMGWSSRALSTRPIAQVTHDIGTRLGVERLNGARQRRVKALSRSAVYCLPTISGVAVHAFRHLV